MISALARMAKGKSIASAEATAPTRKPRIPIIIALAMMTGILRGTARKLFWICLEVYSLVANNTAMTA